MKLKLNQKQLKTKQLIEQLSSIVGLDPTWANAIALTESSLGLNLESPTHCKGVFGMSSIAMKDLLQSMTTNKVVGTLCGIAFLCLLLERWKTIEKASNHFCDPKDLSFYFDKVKLYMKQLEGLNNDKLV